MTPQDDSDREQPETRPAVVETPPDTRTSAISSHISHLPALPDTWDDLLGGRPNLTAGQSGEGDRVEELLVELETAMEVIRHLDEQVTTLKIAVETNRRIGFAVGLIMRQFDIGEEAAFACLRRVSQDTNRKVVHLADSVIALGHLGTPS